MKKLILLLMLPLLAVSFNSCSDNDKDDPTYEELIVGTWKMTEVIKVEGDNDDASGFDLETIRFNDNKTFQFIGGDDGTYSITGKILTLKYGGDDNDTETIEIVSVNNKECVFKITLTDSGSVGPNSDGGGTTIVEESTIYTVRAIKQ